LTMSGQPSTSAAIRDSTHQLAQARAEADTMTALLNQPLPSTLPLGTPGSVVMPMPQIPAIARTQLTDVASPGSPALIPAPAPSTTSRTGTPNPQGQAQGATSAQKNQSATASQSQSQSQPQPQPQHQYQRQSQSQSQSQARPQSQPATSSTTDISV